MNLIIRGIRLLPDVNKRRLWLIFAIQIIKSFFDIFAIGLIIPVIYILAKGQQSLINILEKKNYLFFISDTIIYSENFIYFIVLLILIIFILKFFFTIFSSFYEQKWLEKANATTSTNLFLNYIDDIENLSIRKNHKLINNIVSEVNIFYKFFVKSLIVAFAEIFKLLGIFCILYIFNPQILIVGISITSILTFVIIKIFKSRLENYGKKRSHNSGLLMRYITEGLNSVKEIKLSHNPIFFLNKFKQYADDNADVQTKFYLLSVLPRQSLELFAIILICSLIYYLSIYYSNDGSSALFALGVYSTALLRLLPSVNIIYMSAQHMLFAKNALQILESEIKSKDNKTFSSFKKFDNKNLKIINSIELKNLSFGYDDKKNQILNKINLKFEKNKIYCFFGNSGSGKSTLVNLIMGFLKPSKGDIIYNSSESIFSNLSDWQKNISFLSQKVFLLNDSIKRNVAFAQEDNHIDTSKIEEALLRTNLLGEFNKFRDGIDTELGDDGQNLSGGQKQRIGIARNLYFNKSILVLDEFTSSLDEINENLIFNEVASNKKDKIIFVITHSKNIKDKCDVVLEVRDKKIILTNND